MCAGTFARTNEPAELHVFQRQLADIRWKGGMDKCKGQAVTSSMAVLYVTILQTASDAHTVNDRQSSAAWQAKR